MRADHFPSHRAKLNVRVSENPFYNRIYNEILKNLSESEDSNEVWLIGGNYKVEAGRLINSKYYISKDAGTPGSMDCTKIQIHVNDEPVDKCREYRDNLMVVYSPMEFVKIFASSFAKAFKSGMNDEKIVIDKKWENRGIKKSKVIPPEGIPLKIKYKIANSEDIKGLKNLKMTMRDCPVKN